MLGGAKQSLALSCAAMEDSFILEQADLIAKAKITNISKPFEVPYLRENPDHKVTFEILDVYKGDQGLLNTQITADFPAFMVTWGPDLNVGEQGEFLFSYNEKEKTWWYKGPGGCTYLSEGAWEKLRNPEKGIIPPSP